MSPRSTNAVPADDLSPVDRYIASQPKAVQSVLERVRAIVKKAVPDAIETISYGIPTYKLAGRTVLQFAAWTEHYSIYPANERLRAAFGDELAPYLSGKGTLRFELARPLPAALIERIAKFRAKEVSGR